MSAANVLGRVLIYGGRGALGAACVSHFKTKNWVSNRKYQIFVIFSEKIKNFSTLNHLAISLVISDLKNRFM